MAAPQHYIRKSVENLVMSSHDAIGQSISNALSFSGVIAQQASQNSSDNKSVSRSPSPGRKPTINQPIDSGDPPTISVEVAIDNSNKSRKNVGEVSPSNLSVSTPLPEQPTLIPLNRSASQECQPRHTNQTVSSSSVLNLTTAGQAKTESKPKKKSWYNALYPTYKNRSDDFKRIFKDIPDDERLIVDYSCAMQKEILVHGRLYVSQKYLCFYANIFRWETLLTLQWKDVSAITKEKTALVIPNAILVSTEKEKHFFTTFSSRDKAFMMLFTIWQNALLDKSISSQELWQMVHSSYGEQLGYDSDDEDNPLYFVDDEKLSSVQFVSDPSNENKAQEIANSNVILNEELSSIMPPKQEKILAGQPQPTDWSRSNNGTFNGGETMPTDMSDTSDSEHDKIGGHTDQPARCTDPHEGRKLLAEEFPFHIDQLFTMLFTNSKFYVELQASRKTTDIVQSSWKHDAENGVKCRKVSFTLLLGHAVGPKTAGVVESQVMLPCTKPGHVYSIEITSTNSGVPYCESFVVVVHYCLQKVSDNVTLFQVFGQIKYKKSVWGFVKSIIEKNCWMGLEEYFDYLGKALHAEVEEERGPLKRKSRRRRRVPGIQRESETGSLPPSPLHRPSQSRKSLTGSPLREKILPSSTNTPSTHLIWTVLGILCILVIINGALYWRLWGLEGGTHGFFGDVINNIPSPVISPGKTPSPDIIAEWSKILRDQSSFQIEELDKWRKALNDAIVLLKQTEGALANLQTLVRPSVDNQNQANSDL